MWGYPSFLRVPDGVHTDRPHPLCIQFGVSYGLENEPHLRMGWGVLDVAFGQRIRPGYGADGHLPLDYVVNELCGSTPNSSVSMRHGCGNLNPFFRRFSS